MQGGVGGGGGNVTAYPINLDKKQSRGGTSAVSSKLASGYQQPIAMLDMPLLHPSAKGRHGDRPSPILDKLLHLTAKGRHGDRPSPI